MGARRNDSHSIEAATTISSADWPEWPSCSSERDLVSVVLPAFNMARYIERTIVSAQNQTHRNLEIIVVDDGSTDETPDIVARLTATDSRIRLLVQRNAGVAAARNAAIAASAGHIIAPLDADDLWHPEKIERQLARFRQCREEVALVYCSSVLIDADDYLVWRAKPSDRFEFEGRVAPALIWRNFGCASVPLIRRGALLAVGGYDPLLRGDGAEGCEDKDLYIKLSERWPFARVPEVLVGHRMRLDGMSHDTRSMHRSHKRVVSAARQRNPGLPRKVIRWSHARVDVALSLRAAARKRYASAAVYLLRALALDPLYVLANALRLLKPHGERLGEMWLARSSRRFADLEPDQAAQPQTGLARRQRHIRALCSDPHVERPSEGRTVPLSAAMPVRP